MTVVVSLALVVAVGVVIAVVVVTSRPTFPEAAIGTWDCTQVGTVVVEDGRYELRAEDGSLTARGRWRLDGDRLVLTPDEGDEAQVEGVPDAADDAADLLARFGNGETMPVDLRPGRDGEITLIFPEFVVFCDRRG